jgi:hypothetical protein
MMPAWVPDWLRWAFIDSQGASWCGVEWPMLALSIVVLVMLLKLLPGIADLPEVAIVNAPAWPAEATAPSHEPDDLPTKKRDSVPVQVVGQPLPELEVALAGGPIAPRGWDLGDLAAGEGGLHG